MVTSGDLKPLYDVIVVGGGVIGASSAAAIARKGVATVLLCEQFEPGHDHGSSHGDGRIFRLAYQEDDYVAIAKAALIGWRELERDVQEELLLKTGGITAASSGLLHHLDTLANTFEKQGLEYERLDAASLNSRFPQYRLEPDDEAIYQKDSGVLKATKTVQALWKWAGMHKADFLTNTKVTSFRHNDEGMIIVQTETGKELLAKKVVLALGGWSAKMLGLPISVTEETVAYFQLKVKEAEGVDHTYESMPVFIFHHTNGVQEPDVGYYGLPQVDILGVKAAAHHTGPEVDPDNRGLAEHEKKSIKILESVKAFVGRFLPHLISEPTTIQKCLYSVTPDHDFIIDRHPDIPGVYIAAGFSGHGFKFGPAIGEIMASLALDLPLSLPIERFRLSRFHNLSKGTLVGYK